MKKITSVCAIVILVVSVITIGTAGAYDNNLIQITAEQAFDAYANQVDPKTGDSANVVIVDVRTTAEYHWVGTCAQADEIKTVKEGSIFPENGKVQFETSKILKFEVGGVQKVLQINQIDEIVTCPIAINIPYETWDEKKCTKVINKNFSDEIEALIETYNVLILMCRSGKRTSNCVADFNTNLFDAVYEIDQPDGKNGRGGFQGTSYDDAYNGYRGFPLRNTCFQSYPSVSWSDAGLPIHIGTCPEDVE